MTEYLCICNGCDEWTTGDGEEIPVCRMSTNHLHNAINWIGKQKSPQEGYDHEDFYASYDDLKEHWLPLLEAELERRKTLRSPRDPAIVYLKYTPPELNWVDEVESNIYGDDI